MKDLTTSPQLLEYLTTQNSQVHTETKSFQSTLRVSSSSKQTRSGSKTKIKSKTKEHNFHAPKESILENDEEEDDGAVIVASKAVVKTNAFKIQ
jgi:lipopolysaccharide export system protein LptC